MGHSRGINVGYHGGRFQKRSKTERILIVDTRYLVGDLMSSSKPNRLVPPSESSSPTSLEVDTIDTSGILCSLRDVELDGDSQDMDSLEVIGEQGSIDLVAPARALDFSTPEHQALQLASDAAPEMVETLIGIARCKPEDASNRIKAATVILNYALGLPRKDAAGGHGKRKTPAELREMAASLGIDLNKLVGR